MVSAISLVRQLIRSFRLPIRQDIQAAIGAVEHSEREASGIDAEEQL